MLRIILIAVCTYALANINLSSPAALESIVYPDIAFVFVFFLMFEFLVFLRSSNLDLSKEVKDGFGGIYSNLLDVVIVIVDDRSDKYRGSFSVLGPFEGFAEDMAGYSEIVWKKLGSDTSFR